MSSLQSAHHHIGMSHEYPIKGIQSKALTKGPPMGVAANLRVTEPVPPYLGKVVAAPEAVPPTTHRGGTAYEVRGDKSHRDGDTRARHGEDDRATPGAVWPSCKSTGFTKHTVQTCGAREEAVQLPLGGVECGGLSWDDEGARGRPGREGPGRQLRQAEARPVPRRDSGRADTGATWQAASVDRRSLI